MQAGDCAGFDGEMGGLPQGFPSYSAGTRLPVLAAGYRPVEAMALAVASRCSPGLGGMSQG